MYSLDKVRNFIRVKQFVSNINEHALFGKGGSLQLLPASHLMEGLHFFQGWTISGEHTKREAAEQDGNHKEMSIDLLNLPGQSLTTAAGDPLWQTPKTRSNEAARNVTSAFNDVLGPSNFVLPPCLKEILAQPSKTKIKFKRKSQNEEGKSWPNFRRKKKERQAMCQNKEGPNNMFLLDEFD